MGAKSPSPLAAFAYNWIGGDIHGLSAFSGTLYGYVPEVTNVVTSLDNRVQRIVGDASWTGNAASAFTKAWEKDSSGATALGIVIMPGRPERREVAGRLPAVLQRLHARGEHSADAGRKRTPDGVRAD